MKRTLATLLALVMVLSTVSFAAPVTVDTVTTSQENTEQDYTVPQEKAEITGETDTVDWVDDTYGHLVFKLDFESSEEFVLGRANAQMYKHGVLNPRYNANSNTTWWINPSSFGTVKKVTEGDNSYLNLGNGKDSDTFQLMFETNLVTNTGDTLGTFTNELGYYTYSIKVRPHLSANTLFTKLENQNLYKYYDGTTYKTLTVPGGTAEMRSFTNNEWKTVVHTQGNKVTGSNAPLHSIHRYRPIFFYSAKPSAADVDTFDVDDVMLYFKPFSVNVTVLGNENVQDQTIKIDIPADTLKSVYTKAELLSLVNAKTHYTCKDLTLEDGSSFEEIDIVEINRLKGVYKTYQVNHPDYGTLLYDIDFETNTEEYGNYNNVSSHGFVNTAFEGSEKWVVNVNAYSPAKVTENGNSFVRFGNTGNRYPQFQVMSVDPYSGAFTEENGFFTVMADAKMTLSGNAGANFKEFRTQIYFDKGSESPRVENKNHTTLVSGADFVTSKVETLYYGDVNSMRRVNYIFEYDADPTKNGVDTLDIDNIKVYYKPKKVNIKIEADEALSIPEKTIEVTVSDVSYVMKKTDILPLIKVDTDTVIADLTLSDGSAFETVDLDSNTTFKAVYKKYDIYDDTYGHLLYNLDFETDVDYSENQLALLQGYVNPSFEGSGDWKVNGPSHNVTKVIDENGNAFIRMKNVTGQHNEFHVMSIDPYKGVFTKENGYYTVFADVRTDISGSAGVNFKNFWLQAGFQKDGTAVNPGVGDYKPTSEFTTAKMDLYYEGADALRRIKHIFTYELPGATVAGVDTLDIDNLRLYFKPLSVDVTVLAGDNADFEEQKVTVAIDEDTLDSTITKAELMALVENDTDMILCDLTHSDGTAFETIDVVKVNEVKAVWMTKAPEARNVSSIRTTDPTGIRFCASVTNGQKETAAEYGFIVTLEKHLGTLAATDVTIDSDIIKVIGINYGYDKKLGKNVDRIFDTEEDRILFTAVVYGIPANATAYGENIVVRAYLKDENGNYYYAAPVVKSVKQVAIDIRDGEYEKVDAAGRVFVESILEICGEPIE